MAYAPLQGIVVLDLTQSLAGPFAGMLMGDLGADVIKIEMPVTGDGARKWGPPFAGDSGPTFVGFNRNKRSCAIDLHLPEGRAQVIHMAKTADVVLENFRPGTMKKFGVDYDTLKVHNPRLIYASISGYGQKGPLSGWAAMDLMIQAISGMMSVTGEPQGRPVKAAAPIADLMGGYTAAFSVLAAIHERSTSGQGRRIDVSMLDAMITVLGQSVVATTISGEPPERQGNAHHLMAPYQSFRTATGDFVISLTIQKRWAALCTLPEFTHMFDDPGFQTQDQRNTNRARLCSEMEAIFMTKPVDYWMAHFARLALPAAPVNTIPQILENEHLAQRGTLLEVEYPPGSGRKYKVPGMPWRDVAAEQPLRSPPAVGQHTDEVLEQFGIGKGAAGRKTAAG